MEKQIITYRKSTPEELENGSLEMTIVDTQTIILDETEPEKTDIISMLKRATPEELAEIKKILGI